MGLVRLVISRVRSTSVRLVVVPIAALFVLVAAAAPAMAAFPGENGRLAFEFDADVYTSIVPMAGGLGIPINITNSDDDDAGWWQPRFSADGTKLVASGQDAIRSIGVDGTGFVDSGVQGDDADFLATGRIFYRNDNQFRSMNRDGSAATTLYTVVLAESWFVQSARVSPDGTKIFWSEIYAPGGHYTPASVVRVVTLGTGIVETLVTSTDALRVHDVSPAGNQLLIRRTPSGANTWQNYVLTLTGGAERAVGLPKSGDATFSPDGTLVAYGSLTRPELRVVGIDGTNDRVLATFQAEEDTTLPYVAWQPLPKLDLVVNVAGDEPDTNIVDSVCDVDTDTVGEQCTLRAAIENVNRHGVGVTTVEFDVPNGGSVPVITPGSALPSVERPIKLDGSSQPGSAKVRIDGNGAGTNVHGLRLVGGKHEVRGLVVTRFKGNGIVVDGGVDTRIGDSFIGTDETGACPAACALGNHASGVRITGSATRTWVGLPMHLTSAERVSAADSGQYVPQRNTIANNGDDAVTVVSGRANSVAGNMMHSNGDLAIDLGGDGMSANDELDLDAGPNDRLNAPVATSSYVHDARRRAGRALYIGAPRKQHQLVGYWVDACTDPFEAQADALGEHAVGEPFTTSAEGVAEPTGSAEVSGRTTPASMTFAVVDGEGNTSEVSNCTIDTDADAIDDGFERHGADIDRDGTAEVPLDRLGAKVGRADVFVEVDWTAGHAFDAGGMQRVQQAFLDSPRPNVDATTGIRLHIDHGPGSRLVDGGTWGDLSRGTEIGNEFESPSSGAWEVMDSAKAKHLDAARRPFFRYALSVRHVRDSEPETLGWARNVDHTGGAYGISTGSDFALGLGAFCTPVGSICPGPVDAQAGGFMHELGHSLGLRHGGIDDEEGKPQFLSVMNYFYVAGTYLEGESPSSQSLPILDYSQVASPPAGGPKGTVSKLDEADIREADGIIATGEAASMRALKMCEDDSSKSGARFELIGMNQPVDWDCDGEINAPYEFDLNNSGGEPLAFESISEWTRLRFYGGSTGGKWENPRSSPEIEQLDPIDLHHFTETVPVLQQDVQAPTATIDVQSVVPDRGVVRVSAADDRQLDSMVVFVNGQSRTISATGSAGSGAANRAALDETIVLGAGTHTVEALAFDRALHQSTRVAREIVVPATASPRVETPPTSVPPPEPVVRTSPRLQITQVALRRGQLTVVGGLDPRATGTVQVTLSARGRTTRYVVRAGRTFRLGKRLPRTFATATDGTVDVRYAGDRTLRADAVRLRVARNPARLAIRSVTRRSGRLTVTGSVRRGARGAVVVRLQTAAGDVLLKAPIRANGTWTVTRAVTAGGWLVVEYTGHAASATAGQRIGRLIAAS